MILIDGYNLMMTYDAQGRKCPNKSFEQRREALLHYLSNHLEGRSVKLVFDAGGEMPHGENRGDIRLKFVNNADQAILDEVANDKDKEIHTVVTSDEKLRQSVEQFKVRVVRSEKFLADIQDKAARSSAGPEDPKPPPPSDAEVRDWVKRFTDAPPPED